MSAYVYTARHPRNARRVMVVWKDQQGNRVGTEVVDCLMMAFLYKPSAGGGFYLHESRELEREQNWARRSHPRRSRRLGRHLKPRCAAVPSHIAFRAATTTAIT